MEVIEVVGQTMVKVVPVTIALAGVEDQEIPAEIAGQLAYPFRH